MEIREYKSKRYIKALAEEAIKVNAGVLEIPKPCLVFVGKDELPAPTTRMAYSPERNEIAINTDMLPISNADILFTISHEMRHVWQAKTGYIGLNDYMTAAKASLKDYNSQAAEVDAHAWGIVITSSLLGIRPKLEDVEGIGPEVFALIDKRAKEIVKEWDQ